MNLSLGDIGDLFKMAHAQQETIQSLKEEVRRLRELLKEEGQVNGDVDVVGSGGWDGRDGDGSAS